MPWIKIPASHHPVFRAALPGDVGITTVQMFGGIAAKVNGRTFAALFGRSVMVGLGPADRADALALDGATPFDPMGRGRTESDKVMLPEDVFHDPDELRRWLTRALAYTAALPDKTKKAARATAKRPGERRRTAKRQTTGHTTTPKPAATTPKPAATTRRRSRR